MEFDVEKGKFLTKSKPFYAVYMYIVSLFVGFNINAKQEYKQYLCVC